MIAQRHLKLEIHERSVLVAMATVLDCFEVDSETISARVDGGELRWVWDVSAGNGEIRELRFWKKELIAPEFCAQMSVTEVIKNVIGSEKPRWRGSELRKLLAASRPLISRLNKSGELKGDIVNGTLYVNRAVLEKFLTKRLVNN